MDKALAVQGAQVAQAAAVDLVVQMVEALPMLMAARAELMGVVLEHLMVVMAVPLVLAQSVSFGPVTQEHSHQQTPATYECAGSSYYCCLG